jgi:hypothetical protein
MVIQTSGLIAEAERRGDYAELAILTQKKLEIDRELRRMRRAGDSIDI